MKIVIIAAGFLVIAATFGATFVGYTFYHKSKAESLVSQCQEFARTDPATLSDFERVQAKSLAEKCKAYRPS